MDQDQHERKIIVKIILLALRAYQNYISPCFPSSCKYFPTCSEYAYQAFQKHGVCIGIILSFWRILRCNPFVYGGSDPVPNEIKITSCFMKN